eukprot:TRINITY_DN13825_c0_g5_i1.p1 TRINITY_DN13825_c0_g5~~TRINITY_DN13825_c0_g5_i1.p1  ORF type:complete len:354 (+),score=61.23 TRINITY_DN13825_c0_g5_i1:89-1063(+)
MDAEAAAPGAAPRSSQETPGVFVAAPEREEAQSSRPMKFEPASRIGGANSSASASSARGSASSSTTPASASRASGSRTSVEANACPWQTGSLTRTSGGSCTSVGLGENAYAGEREALPKLPLIPCDDSDEEGELGYRSNNVWVNVYETDPYTAWLNWAGLSYAEIPIHHAGVEVYGNEWAFQYYTDTWDDPSISGLVCCRPREMESYVYQESFCLGPTSLSERDVDIIIDSLRSEWPACSYHITRRNCLAFARDLVQLLKVPKPFPSVLLGFTDAQHYIPKTEAVIDQGWNLMKWWNGWATLGEERQSEANGAAARGAASHQTI